MSAEVGELDLLRGLAGALETAPHGSRSALVADAARTLGVSSQETYRRLKQRDLWHSGRKPRSDRGRISVPEDVAIKAGTLVHKARRRHGKRTMPMTVALDVLRENGEGAVNPETGEVTLDVSTATLSRAMRRYNCHPAMLARGKPHTHLRSEYPNQCWQIDASLCVLFYLPKQGLAAMPEGVFYKNKPLNLSRVEKERVWRYVVTDHYSGAFYVRYVQAPGESSESLVETFLQAIAKRGQDDPMHGVPEILMMDAGSANTSHLFLNLLDRLGVRHITHLPGNPRAKGQVESTMNLVETQFEGRLAYRSVNGLADLQETADKWRRHYNAWAVHTRHHTNRNEMWLSITEAQLRLAPPIELCRELVTTRPVEATVRPDLSVTHSVKGFGRGSYDVRLLPGIVPGVKVRVVVNPYRAPAVDVILKDLVTGEDRIWTVEPVALDEAGFRADAAVIGREHKALPDTVADERLKEIAAATGGDGRQTGQAPFGLDVFADVRPAPTYIGRRGRDLGLDAGHREIAPLSHVEAAMQLKARLGQSWNAERYAWLRQRWPDGVPPQEIEAIAANLSGPAIAQAAPLRVIGGGA